MSFTWMFLFIVLILIEILTVNLVSIWFAIGVLAAFLTSLLTSNVFIQVLIFMAVTMIMLLITKKIINKLKDKKITPTNLDRVIGKTGIVTEKIDNLEPGEVKVDGKRWTAVSNISININEKVKIISIDGVKLNVIKQEEVLK